jgi:hypothetical protein
MVTRKIAPAVLWTLLLAAATAAAQQTAEKPATPPEGEKKIEYMRAVRDKDNIPTALETAIVRFGPSDPEGKGPTVDLVAVMHIADKGYYEQINREFAQYDVVLYELVAPEGSEVPNGDDAVVSPLGLLQTGMQDLLGLEHQLSQIDYARKNMVHADMSPEEFAKSMEDRRESFLAMILRMTAYAMARQQESDGQVDERLLEGLLEDDPSLALKRLLADQFEDTDRWLAAIEGPQGYTLISQRNKVALDELSKQLAAGKQKIAIFYGAAHMPDFQRRLGEQFQLKPSSTRWLVAWKLESPPAGEQSDGAAAGQGVQGDSPKP